jgi:hypothetical protein
MAQKGTESQYWRLPMVGMANKDKARRLSNAVINQSEVWRPRIDIDAVPHERVMAVDLPRGAQLPRRWGKPKGLAGAGGMRAAAKRAMRS